MAYACVFPVRTRGGQREILLGRRKHTPFGDGFFDGYGGSLKPGESPEVGALRHLHEECGLQGVLRPRGEVVVLFDGKQRTRHYIFLAEVEGDATESMNMAPRWFEVGSVPFKQMEPDIQEWLPQVLQDWTFLSRGYYELAQGRLTRSLPLSPALLPGVLPATIAQRLVEVVGKQGAAFDVSFEGSIEEFELAWAWTWAAFGEVGGSRSMQKPPRRSYSTADNKNRLEDKAWVESELLFREGGDPSDPTLIDGAGDAVATGYAGVVHGDHGPYIEVYSQEVHWPRFRHHVLKGPARTHMEHYSADGVVKLYDQFRTVWNQPNPPRGARSTANNRPDGYADYRPGCMYIPCDGCVRLEGTGKVGKPPWAK